MTDSDVVNNMNDIEIIGKLLSYVLYHENYMTQEQIDAWERIKASYSDNRYTCPECNKPIGSSVSCKVCRAYNGNQPD